MEQRGVDEFFELLDALGDHRVRDAELARRLCEAFGLGDPDERLDTQEAIHGLRAYARSAGRARIVLFLPTSSQASDAQEAGACLERNGMRWNRMRFHLIPFARTGDHALG